jgi:hypothetical protein
VLNERREKTKQALKLPPGGGANSVTLVGGPEAVHKKLLVA